MPHARSLRFRQVHLDYHNSPLIPDVAADFDPDAFAGTLEAACVDSCTLFAKCHHGMSYYDTAVGVRHPSLKFDLLGAQIRACHARGIRTPVYLSCVWDCHAADQHPEWEQRGRDGERVGAKPGEAGWRWLCLNSPYVDSLHAQTLELLQGYPVDGFFFDIVFQAEPGCWCSWCRESMGRLGLNPDSDDDQRWHSQAVIDAFMERLSSAIWERRPDATVFYNGRVRQGMHREAGWMSHAEIEALPTGGWGYAYFPFWARYARTLGLSILGMTGRFHRSWADFGGLKSPAALRFECGSMLANGAACSIGDQMHPRGALSPAVYEVIGEAFRHVAALEPWCAGAVPETEVALVLMERASHKTVRNDSDEGAARMLLELHHQFDLVERDGGWERYRALVIADRGAPDPEFTDRLRRYLQGGGRVLFSHEALLDPARGEFALPRELGIRCLGRLEHAPGFFRLRPNFRHGIPDFEWAMLGGGLRVEPAAGTDVLADALESYFNRTAEHFTSHGYSPHAGPAGCPAATWNGSAVYIYGPVFGDYQNHGDVVYRRMVGNALDLLIPDRLLAVDAPATTEATVARQGDRLMVHLVNYHPNRRGAHPEVIERTTPLRDVEVVLRTPFRPSRVRVVPDGTRLAVEHRGGASRVVVPRVEEHAVIAFEP